MKTARYLAQTWPTTAGTLAQVLGVAGYNTCALLAIALEPKREPRKKAEPKVPHEGTWWERTLGVKSDGE